jgi:2-polyprenyl-6-methoxyphenol hydroxylase-like FAD-dependent oxidoreductase
VSSEPNTRASPTPRCCIVGVGPAGMMLGYLLARGGVPVTVLEKHADFLRDFRGDTVHPSTLQVLDEIGLLEKFDRLPQRKVRNLSLLIEGRMQPMIDFRGLKPFDYMALVPQWDFLDLLASAGRQYPQFDLRMRHEATGLVEENGRVAGVRVRSPEGESELRAGLVVACDGRHSTVRAAAGLRAVDYGAPMDALWFRVPRKESDPEDTFGIVSAGRLMVLLNRTDYWQAAYVVPKGSDDDLRARPIGELRATIAKLAPFLADRPAPASWDDVKTLEVRVDRLERWHRPGLLLIGDAAHAMSPIGGVGINLAIQDAVAAANALAPVLRSSEPVGEAPLRAIEARRLLPTKLTQALQLQVQNRVISRALAQSGRPLTVPAFVRALLRLRIVRNIPARLFGYGVRREHVSRVLRERAPQPIGA